MNETIDTILKRRSVRKYRAEQIRPEELEQIIEAGLYAPTACNEQPWHFTVIQNPDVLKTVNDITLKGMSESAIEWHQKMAANPAFQVTFGSPVLIVVSGRADATAPAVDCAAALENMMIAAQSLGIGSVWLGLVRYYLADAAQLAKLGIPEGYKPFYSASFGYPADGLASVAPKRNKDVVSWIK